jgi:hypothetical protein
MKRPKQVPSFVTAYAYEPLADDPAGQLGNLYVVLEALVSGRASEEVADLVIETAGDHYYNHEDNEDKPPLERFEAAVKAINRELSEHVNRGNAAWIGKLSAIVAIQAGNEIHIAQTGSAEASMYRGKAVTRISAPTQTRPTAPSKTFGSIASGQIEAGDKLLLATPALIHQVPLTRLQSVITQSSPNVAIAEITALLKGASVDRIAALVIEITTPELAALQVRSEEPSEIQLGSPETPLEAARMVAAPIAHSTVASSRRIAHAAQAGAKRTEPYARTAGLKLAELTRKVLRTANGRRKLALGLAAGVIAVALIIAWRMVATADNHTISTYQSLYQSYVSAGQIATGGDRPAARKQLVDLSAKLASLKRHHSTIDKYLGSHKLPAGEPKTYSEFAKQVTVRVDELDGLSKVQAVTVAKFSAKNAHYDHIEVANGTAYVFDSSHANALTIVSLASGSLHDSKIDSAKIGRLVATTLSSAGDGIYIMSDQPSLWFYRFDNDSLVQQTVSFGQWTRGTAIASYAANLYVLSPEGVYRYAKSSTGFSPRTLLIPTKDEATANASGLAVDGSVYLATPAGLHRFIGGALSESAPAPEGLGLITNLHADNNSGTLIGTASGSKRVAVWSANPNLSFNRQISLSNVGALYDAAFDQSSGQGYGLADGRLVRWPITP